MTTTARHTALRSFDQLFIGGRWVDPASDRRIDVVSPVSEEVIASVPAGSTADIDLAVGAAKEAFEKGPWPGLPATQRAAALRRLADEIQARLPEMVHAFTAEVGAPLPVSQAFHDMAVSLCRRNADLVENLAIEDRRTWDEGSGTVCTNRSVSSRRSCRGTGPWQRSV